MKIGLINGSPRGVKSNSDKILRWITPDVETEKIYAVKIKQHTEAIEKLIDCDLFIFAFPLYTDSMPGVMKAFLEEMDTRKEVFADKKAIFIIHSGFTEAVHSRAVERYVRYFATKVMGMQLLGSIVMGGSEALQAAPEEYFNKKIKAFSVLKNNIVKSQELDEDSIKTIAGIERFNRPLRILMRIAKMSNVFWNRQLKQNGAYEDRFNTPYWE